MKISSIFYAIGLFTAFSSCTVPCDEPDIQKINALYFELQQGGENGFDPAALDQIILVRYVPFSQPLIADTLFTNGNYPEGEGRFFINDEYPFRNEQSPYYTVYSYFIEDPTSGYVANIENIELMGVYDGECNYYNTQKKFTLNGDTVDLAGSTVFVPITK